MTFMSSLSFISLTSNFLSLGITGCLKSQCLNGRLACPQGAVQGDHGQFAGVTPGGSFWPTRDLSQEGIFEILGWGAGRD